MADKPLGERCRKVSTSVPPGTWYGRMAIDPRGTDVVLGSHGGVWASNTPVSAWTLARDFSGVGIRSLGSSAADPGEVWLASWGSGVWHRSSSEMPWQRIPATALAVDYAFAVAADPVIPGRVFVGAWSELYGSTDDGSTFKIFGLGHNEFAIGFDPSRSTVIHAGTQVAGVFKSTDSGATFVAASTDIPPWATQAGNSAVDVRQLAIDPASPDTVYIGTNGGGVWKTVDGAQSWSNVWPVGEAVSCLLVVPGASSTVYACIAGGGVQRSVDGGATWTDITLGLPSLDAQGIISDPATGSLYISSAAGVYVKRGSAAWAGSICRASMARAPRPSSQRAPPAALSWRREAASSPTPFSRPSVARARDPEAGAPPTERRSRDPRRLRSRPIRQPRRSREAARRGCDRLRSELVPSARSGVQAPGRPRARARRSAVGRCREPPWPSPPGRAGRRGPRGIQYFVARGRYRRK